MSEAHWPLGQVAIEKRLYFKEPLRDTSDLLAIRLGLELSAASTSDTNNMLLISDQPDDIEDIAKIHNVLHSLKENHHILAIFLTAHVCVFDLRGGKAVCCSYQTLAGRRVKTNTLLLANREVKLCTKPTAIIRGQCVSSASSGALHHQQHNLTLPLQRHLYGSTN